MNGGGHEQSVHVFHFIFGGTYSTTIRIMYLLALASFPALQLCQSTPVQDSADAVCTVKATGTAWLQAYAFIRPFIRFWVHSFIGG